MSNATWLGAALLLVTFSMTLEAQPARDWTTVRRVFRQQVTDAGIVGASLVIVREGKVEGEEYVGYQDQAARRPVDRDTMMVRYLGFLIGNPARAGYEGVLRRASLEEMWKPVIRANDGEGGSGGDVQAALSFFVERHRGVEVIGHSGNQNGFLSHLYVHRASRSAYLVAFNTDASSTSRGRPRITRDVDDAVRDRVLEVLVAKP